MTSGAAGEESTRDVVAPLCPRAASGGSSGTIGTLAAGITGYRPAQPGWRERIPARASTAPAQQPTTDRASHAVGLAAKTPQRRDAQGALEQPTPFP